MQVENSSKKVRLDRWEWQNFVNYAIFLARAPAMCIVNTDLISGPTLNQPVMSLNKVCIPSGKLVRVIVEMKDHWLGEELLKAATLQIGKHLWALMRPWGRTSVNFQVVLPPCSWPAPASGTSPGGGTLPTTMALRPVQPLNQLLVGEGTALSVLSRAQKHLSCGQGRVMSALQFLIAFWGLRWGVLISVEPGTSCDQQHGQQGLSHLLWEGCQPLSQCSALVGPPQPSPARSAWTSVCAQLAKRADGTLGSAIAWPGRGGHWFYPSTWRGCTLNPVFSSAPTLRWWSLCRGWEQSWWRPAAQVWGGAAEAGLFTLEKRRPRFLLSTATWKKVVAGGDWPLLPGNQRWDRRTGQVEVGHQGDFRHIKGD